MRFLTILTLAALAIPASAQTRGTNCDNTLFSQAEVDAFDCTELLFGLIIGNRNSDIANLDGLAELASTTGNLEIVGNTILTSTSGLSSLRSVSLNLEISGNSALTNLSGFGALTVGGSLRIVANGGLTDLSGLG